MLQFELLVHLVHHSFLLDEYNQNSGSAKFCFESHKNFTTECRRGEDVKIVRATTQKLLKVSVNQCYPGA